MISLAGSGPVHVQDLLPYMMPAYARKCYKTIFRHSTYVLRGCAELRYPKQELFTEAWSADPTQTYFSSTCQRETAERAAN